MASVPQTLRMSEDAYFEMLEKSIDKYEYWNGVAVAMAGAQPDHVAVETNILGELFGRLRGKGCRPLGANQAVKLTASRGYVFPDVTVVCGPPEYVIRRGIGCLVNPSVIVEVLSPTTATRDETEKFLEYTRIRSVREYVVVSTDVYAVKLFSRRTPDEIWSARIFVQLTDEVFLESCGCNLTLAEIYAGVAAQPAGLE